jgi:WD repeat-containing protein 23
MESGAFGTYDWRSPNRKAIARRILDRELGVGGPPAQKMNQGLMAQVRR